MLVVISLVGILWQSRKLKEKEQTWKEGQDTLRVQKVECQAEREGLYMSTCVCLYALMQLQYDLWVCLRLCHPVKQLSWEHGCQRSRHISITVFVLLVNVIQYLPPPHKLTQASLLCFYFDISFDHLLFFSCSFSGTFSATRFFIKTKSSIRHCVCIEKELWFSL